MDMGTAGGGTAAAITQYPYPGQSGVQTTFEGEYPNPLAGKTDPTTAGYLITLAFNDPNMKSVQVTAATLSDSSQSVPVWEYDDHTWTDTNPIYSGDTMGNSVALIAQEPLLHGIMYTAEVTGTLLVADGSTHPFDQRWSFTTAAPPVMWRQGGDIVVFGAPLSDLNVYSDGPFHPSQVSRVGALTIIPGADVVRVSASGGAIASGGAPFPDASSVPWALPDMYAAKVAGWIRPKPRQRVLTPGSPSHLRPRKLPSMASQRTAVCTSGGVGGATGTLWR